MFKRAKSTVLLTSVLFAACSDDGPAGPDVDERPDTGVLEAATATTGEGLDPDGYSLSVDGGAAQAIGVNSTLTIADLTPGGHMLELTGVAENCALIGNNPRSVAVTAGGTARTTFEVSCMATGTLRVSVITFDRPFPGVIVTATGSGGPLSGITGAEGRVEFTNIPPGSFAVNAAVGGGICTSQTATVTAGQTTDVTVTCDPGMVRGRVTVNGVGEPDVTVFVSIVGTTTGPDGRYEFVPFRPGMYTVGILPPPGATCPTIFQDVLLPPGGTATADFACTR